MPAVPHTVGAHSLRRRWGAGLALAVGCLAVGGCTGWAEFSLIPLDQGRISKSAPLIVELRAAECYYSIDDGRISIAWTDENISVIGEWGKKSVVGSIVLDGLPAHESRDYRLDRNSIRGRQRHGPKHVRFGSLGGILALWLDGENQIKGRLRARVRQQHFNVLLGWTQNRPVLLVGDFVAVRDRARTEEIVRRSETGGMARAPGISKYGKPRRVIGPPVHPPDHSRF